MAPRDPLTLRAAAHVRLIDAEWPLMRSSAGPLRVGRSPVSAGRQGTARTSARGHGFGVSVADVRTTAALAVLTRPARVKANVGVEIQRSERGDLGSSPHVPKATCGLTPNDFLATISRRWIRPAACALRGTVNVSCARLCLCSNKLVSNASSGTLFCSRKG